MSPDTKELVAHLREMSRNYMCCNSYTAAAADEIERLDSVATAETNLRVGNFDTIEALRAENERLRRLLLNLCNAADDVGVNHFDTECPDVFVTRMDEATQAARAALAGGAP